MSSFPCAGRNSAGAHGWGETLLVRRSGLTTEFHSPVFGGQVEESGQLCLGTGHTIRRKNTAPPNNSKMGVERAVFC